MSTSPALNVNSIKNSVKLGGRRNSKVQQNNNFLAQISNALAANPSNNSVNERHQLGLNQQNPSFTIPYPNMNNASHKESWFGSFGNYGRKSTDYQARTSFSLGQEQSSSGNQNMPTALPVTNYPFSTGFNHKLSLTAVFNNAEKNN